MPPIRTERDYVRRSSRQQSMTLFSDDDLQLFYPDSDSDTTSSAPSSPPIFPISPFVLALGEDVRHIISYSPAAMKYIPEISPACPYYKTSSHSAKRDPGHTPRPPNAFLIYRSWFCATRRHAEEKHNILSKQAGAQWKSLPEREQGPFKRAADVVQERHAALYPTYKYSPTTDKTGAKAARAASKPKSSKKRRSQKTRITVATAPSPSPSFDVPAPSFASPSSSQLMTFDFAPVELYTPEVEVATPEFSFDFMAIGQISPMMLPERLIGIEELGQKLSEACNVTEPHNMAADERVLLAPSYPEELPLAMYDVSGALNEYAPFFPSSHEPTAYSPESTPPPYDTSAPGWSLDFSTLAALEAAQADDMFNQYITFD